MWNPINSDANSAYVATLLNNNYGSCQKLEGVLPVKDHHVNAEAFSPQKRRVKAIAAFVALVVLFPFDTRAAKRATMRTLPSQLYWQHISLHRRWASANLRK